MSALCSVNPPRTVIALQNTIEFTFKRPGEFEFFIIIIIVFNLSLLYMEMLMASEFFCFGAVLQ